MRSQPILFDLFGHPLCEPICRRVPSTIGIPNSRNIPDGETYLKIDTDVAGLDCIVLADLSHPDPKFLPLCFVASTLKELNANSVGLVALYLPYVRQDHRFKEGEAVSSRVFADVLSSQIDLMVTVDPHLHRYGSLSEIYSIPTLVARGSRVFSEWLENEKNTFLVGFNSESEQWISEIAANNGLPYVIGEKQRTGDRNVSIKLPDLSPYGSSDAVIIDDVISSGHTSLECNNILRAQGIEHIGCICVHGVFADNADERIAESGIDEIVTTNSIPHSSDKVDTSSLLIPAIDKVLSQVHGDQPV